MRTSVNKEFFISEEILKFAFRLFDKDDFGKITFNEIEEVFKDYIFKNANVKESMREIIGEVDINGEGKISFEEFKSDMRKMLYRKRKYDYFFDEFYFSPRILDRGLFCIFVF